MAKLDGPSTTAGGVLCGDIGTALVVATHFALGAGWGTTATAAILSGSTQQRGRIAVTSSGTGQSQATATLVLTFPEPYTAAPYCIPVVTSTSAIDEGHVLWTSTTTALTLTFSVLPVDTKVYTISWILVK
jgi:hypothetical protein